MESIEVKNMKVRCFICGEETTEEKNAFFCKNGSCHARFEVRICKIRNLISIFFVCTMTEEEYASVFIPN